MTEAEKKAREAATLIALRFIKCVTGHEVDAAIDDIAGELVMSILAARRDAIEECAKWHDEQAVACRNIAATTRREWCGPDIPADDRRANYADAREHDALAGVHQRHAAAIRALAEK